MRSVQAWITKHTENPSKARLRMHTELDGALQIRVVQSSGLLQETKYDFVELAAWTKAHPGQEPPRITEMDIEKPNVKVFRREGVMVRATTEGHHSVIRYSDFGQQSSKVVDDGECVITKDQQDLKADVVLACNWPCKLGEGDFGRGDVAIGQCHLGCRLGVQRRPGSR